MPHDNEDFPLPDLRFVPVEALVPHERHDAQRTEPLVRQLAQETCLKNPPVVSALDVHGTPQYVVLDGANRSTAARAAGFPHMLVQVVPYEEPHVRLSTWYHALGDVPIPELQRDLQKITGLECHMEERIHGRALLARREALACIVTGAGAVMALTGGHDLEEKNALLNQVVDVYRGRRFYRVTGDTLAAARERHPDVTAVVVFPHFEPDEILELAMGGSRLPAGITRHLVRWRALRINVPIERLADRTQDVAAKNAWLDAWLADRVRTRHVRFYEEPTVMFDE